MFDIFCNKKKSHLLLYVQVDRMSIVLAILLTGVTFKFSVSELIPVLGYETALESYTNFLVLTVFVSGLVVSGNLSAIFPNMTDI